MEFSSTRPQYLAAWDEAHRDAILSPLQRGQRLQTTKQSSLLPLFADLDFEPVNAVDPEFAIHFRPGLHDLFGHDQVMSFDLQYPLYVDDVSATRRSEDTLEAEARWGQVWVATLITDAEPHPQVVIKLFQESLFPNPRTKDFDNYPWWSAKGHSSREAWAFNRLKPFQGTLLPHSYGFFDFELPCGQTVCGHVMEHVDGKDVKRDYESMLEGSWSSTESQERRRTWMEQISRSVQAFIDADVHHGDLAPRNLLQLRSNPDFFVFVDFSSSSPFGRENYMDRPDYLGLRDVLCEIDTVAVVAKFIDSRRFTNASVLWSPWRNKISYGMMLAESNVEEGKHLAVVNRMRLKRANGDDDAVCN